MVVPPWTKELFSGSLEDVAQRVKTAIGNSQIPATALKGLELVLQETQRGAQQLRRWAKRFSSLSFSAINTSGTYFHEHLQGCPLAAEQLQQMFPGENFSTRQDSLDRRRIQQLACHAVHNYIDSACLIARNTDAAVLAAIASLPPETTLALWRGHAIRLSGERTLPELLGSLGHHVLELGTPSQASEDDWNIVHRCDSGPVVVIDVCAPVSSTTLASHAPPITETASGHPVHRLAISPMGSLRELQGVSPEWTLRISNETLKTAWLTIVPGERLIGGPRSGIILGPQPALERLESTPIWSVLQADLGTSAGVTYTLQQAAPAPFGLEKLIATTIENLQDRGERLAIQLAGDPYIESCQVIESKARIAPDLPREIPSRALRLKHHSLAADAWAKKLAQDTPSLITEVDGDTILVDLRWLPPTLDERIAPLIGKFSPQEE